MKPVLIKGRGIAAVTCAWLLAGQGRKVVLLGKKNSLTPIIILNDITVHLLEDIFSLSIASYDQFNKVESKVVDWGTNTSSFLKENGFIIDGAALNEILNERLFSQYKHQISLLEENDLTEGGYMDKIDDYFDWIIFAEGKKQILPFELSSGRHTYGKRVMVYSTIILQNSNYHNSLIVELTSKGSLICFPSIVKGESILLCTLPEIFGNSVEEIKSVLSLSKLIGPFVDSIVSTHVFRTAPSFLYPTIGYKWIAIGESAMALDPICGDGVGAGLRTALLASASIAMINDISTFNSIARNYQYRLLKTFLSHLSGCNLFYSNKALSDSWEAEKNISQLGVKYLNSLLRDFHNINAYELRRSTLYVVKRSV